MALYDVSSSYYEGHSCPLARYGHDRDGHTGRPIIVYGVLQVAVAVVMAAPTSGAVSAALGLAFFLLPVKRESAVGMWKSRVRSKISNRTGRRSRGGRHGS